MNLDILTSVGQPRRPDYVHYRCKVALFSRILDKIIDVFFPLIEALGAGDGKVDLRFWRWERSGGRVRDDRGSNVRRVSASRISTAAVERMYLGRMAMMWS